MKHQRPVTAGVVQWWWVVPLGLIAGACMTLQARVNSALTAHTGDAILTATLSFGGGFGVLALALLASPSARAGMRRGADAIRSGRLPWWLSIGGASGAFYVFTQGAAVSVVGIALFTVAYVAAQTAGSFLWDHIGLGPSGSHPLHARRIAGAALSVLAVAVAVVSAHGVDATASWLVALPVIAGVGASWQQAANGRVRESTGSVLATTFWNFTVGSTILMLASLVHGVVRPWQLAGQPEWWMFCGGPIGIVFIASAAAIVRRAGVLLLSLLLTLGQLGAALALAPLTPTAPQPELGGFVGTGIALVAVAIMLLPSRQRNA